MRSQPEAPRITTNENRNKQLTYVELYAGVGGWSMALEEAFQQVDPSISLNCAAALDHSDLCMSVYDHNHRPSPQQNGLLNSNISSSSRNSGSGSRKKQEKTTQPAVRIQDLTLEQFLAWQADVIMMSPPCQPHSRQHSNQEKDLQDPRSQSFLHLCQLLSEMPEESLPQLLFLENVVGFEASNSSWRWRKVLAERGYRVGHFHLEPTQVGIPNDRPRYFCVALKQRTTSLAANDESSTASTLCDCYLQQEHFGMDQDSSETNDSELFPVKLHVDLKELDVFPLQDANAKRLPSLQNFLGDAMLSANTKNNNNKHQDLQVPEKILNSSAAWCMDIAAPYDARTACFTSSYGKFVRGTGSVLYLGGKDDDDDNHKVTALVPPQDREFDPNWADGLDLQALRYFSGMEMARLFGFPSRFAFPSSLTTKQQWKLVGNSLNVRVAAKLIELGLRGLWKIPLASSTTTKP